MTKYLLLTLMLTLAFGTLKAQEQESTTTQDEKEEPVVAPQTNEEPQIQKKSEGIIITGPDGVIIEEPSEKYTLDKDESIEEGDQLEIMENEEIVEVEDYLAPDAPEVQNQGGPKIIYYESAGQGDVDRHYRVKSHKSDIKTLAGSMNHSGGFGAVSFRYSDFRDESLVMAGIRGGWIVNRTLGIGFEGHGVIPTSRYDDIDDTRDVVLVGGYGGMFLELIFFSNQVIHVTFPVSAGAGWLGYTEHWENDFTSPPFTPGDSLYLRRNHLIDDDTFWYVEPGVNLELNVSKNFRMDFGVSKRFTQDFNLMNTNDTAFDKPNYYVTLKFGRF